MNKTWIVTIQTYLQQVKSWSFLILLLSPFFLIGISGLSGVSAGRGLSSSSDVAIVAEPTLRRQVMKAVNLDYGQQKTVAQAQQALNKGKIDAYAEMKVDHERLQIKLHGTDTGISAAKSPLLKYATQVQSKLNLTNAKLSANQQATLNRRPRFSETAQNTGPNKLAQKLSYFIMIFMVYFILTTYSSITAQEIASEKGTKIMEIIFSSTTARKYFNGKILGVLLVILTQLLVYLLGGLLGWQLIQHSQAVQQALSNGRQLLTQILQGFSPLNVSFMILGIIIYTILAALTGALVSRAEDASKASQPVVMLSVLSFIAALSQMGSPTGLITVILSYVPFFSSFFMPLRLINGSVAGWQAGLSLGLLIATVLAMIWYIGSIYQRLMLQTDNRSLWRSLRQAIKSN